MFHIAYYLPRGLQLILVIFKLSFHFVHSQSLVKHTQHNSINAGPKALS